MIGPRLQFRNDPEVGAEETCPYVGTLSEQSSCLSQFFISEMPKFPPFSAIRWASDRSAAVGCGSCSAANACWGRSFGVDQVLAEGTKIAPNRSITASISASVVARLRLKRTAPIPTLSGTPMAARTGESSTRPA